MDTMSTGAQATLEVAKGISDYGIMIVICAAFLVLSAALMVTCFKWFKSVISSILNDYSDRMAQIQSTENKVLDAVVDIAEGLIPETQLRIRNIAGVFFDLAIEQACRMIKKLRQENHIANKEATKKKIRTLLRNIHDERNARMEAFRYRGRPLSEYTNPDWVEWVAATIEGELYDQAGENNGRAYTNVKAAYENIRHDFFKRLNHNSTSK